MPKERTFASGKHRVEGVNAEICSVLFADAELTSLILGSTSPDDIVAALDTRTPHEERVGLASKALLAVADSSPLTQWLRPTTRLSTFEYESKYYSGYRDHTIHTLSVYLLGWYIWGTVIQVRESLVRDLRERAKGDMADLTDEHVFAEYWKTAALWHDVGYLFECSDFITDQDVREEALTEINSRMFQDPFSAPLSMIAGRTLTHNEVRDLSRLGRFFPEKLSEAADLFSADDVGRLDKMWRWISYKSKSPTAKIVEFTTQSPAARPAYHDHGVMGALLLSRLASQATDFLAELASSNTPLMPPSALEQAYYAYEGRSGALDAAIESVAFHNFPIGRISPESRNRLVETASPTRLPSLHHMPHLFFMALVDTLQDWDRHHFGPVSPDSVRLSVRSADFLLQATADNVKISVTDGDIPRVLRGLFTDWVSIAAIEKLVVSGPEYTYLTADDEQRDGGTRARNERSVAVLDELRKQLRATAERATEVFVKDPAMAIPRVAERLQKSADDIRLASRKMVLADREKLERSEEYDRLLTLKGMIVGSLALGSEVSRGRITARLGNGGFGAVWAVQPIIESSGDFAYKVFHGNDLRDAEKTRLFRQGFDAMDKLSGHRHIVGVHEYTEFPVGFYMDLIRGHDLQDAPRNPHLGERLTMLQTIADTVVYAHRRDIRHRDLKPGNILIIEGSTPVPVITDFDLAWMSGRSTTIASQLYTSLNYGAPEQFDPRAVKARKNETVDIYGFGALAYFVLAESDPPPNAGYIDLHWTNLRVRLDGLGATTKTADSICSLIRGCVEREPQQRIQSMKIVARELMDLRVSHASPSVSSPANGAASIAEALRRNMSVPNDSSSTEILSETGGLACAVLEFQLTNEAIDFTVRLIPRRENTIRILGSSRSRDDVSRLVDEHLRSLRQSGCLGPSCRVDRSPHVTGGDIAILFRSCVMSEQAYVRLAGTLKRIMQHVEDEIFARGEPPKSAPAHT